MFTMPVDPAQLAASRSRYALVQLATPGAAAAGDPVAFSWSASSIGTADPFAVALAQVRRRLAAAGWTPDAVIPTRHAKTDPMKPAREAAAMSSLATVTRSAVAGSAAPGASEVPGLDGWETDGGASRLRIGREPAPELAANVGRVAPRGAHISAEVEVWEMASRQRDAVPVARMR
jgi:hypothetical protein